MRGGALMRGGDFHRGAFSTFHGGFGSFSTFHGGFGSFSTFHGGFGSSFPTEEALHGGGGRSGSSLTIGSLTFEGGRLTVGGGHTNFEEAGGGFGGGHSTFEGDALNGRRSLKTGGGGSTFEGGGSLDRGRALCGGP